jgi:hypothetical protein
MMKKLEGADLKQVEALVPLLKEKSEEARALVAKIIGDNPAAAGTMQPQNIATDIDCDECGKPMIIRKGRRGPFLGCSGYPKCKNTGEVPAKLMEEMGLNGNGNGSVNSNGHAGNGKATDAKSKKGGRTSHTDAGDDEIETDLTVD